MGGGGQAKGVEGLRACTHCSLSICSLSVVKLILVLVDNAVSGPEPETMVRHQREVCTGPQKACWKSNHGRNGQVAQLCCAVAARSICVAEASDDKDEDRLRNGAKPMRSTEPKSHRTLQPQTPRFR